MTKKRAAAAEKRVAAFQEAARNLLADAEQRAAVTAKGKGRMSALARILQHTMA